MQSNIQHLFFLIPPFNFIKAAITKKTLRQKPGSQSPKGIIAIIGDFMLLVYLSNKKYMAMTMMLTIGRL